MLLLLYVLFKYLKSGTWREELCWQVVFGNSCLCCIDVYLLHGQLTVTQIVLELNSIPAQVLVYWIHVLSSRCKHVGSLS
jgi:hypothetical protein